MAESKTVSTVTVIPLNGTNYPSWKVQCRMVLVREGLWGIVAGTEEPPDPAADAAKYAKYISRSDRALATIVLAVDPSLLYLLGDPVDPAAVWKKLSEQFQKKTWANKLSLRRRLFSMNSGSMREYIKRMTEIFDELAVIAEAISDEDKVVYLLAGLPESYDVLVTAFESGSDTVPPLESVTERLLREEQKLKDREGKPGAARNSSCPKGRRHSRVTTARGLGISKGTARSSHKHSQVLSRRNLHVKLDPSEEDAMLIGEDI